MEIIILFAVAFALILLVKIFANLKFRKSNKNIDLGNVSTEAEFSDNDITLSQALKNFNHFK